MKKDLKAVMEDMNELKLDISMDEDQINMMSQQIRRERGETTPIQPRVELNLVDFELKPIKVPPEQVIFTALAETESQGDDNSPEIIIELATVEELLKQHSAKDSQAIQNVRYRDLETDEWEDFPEKLRIPIDMHNRDREDGADDDSRPHTDESKVPILDIQDMNSASRYTTRCIQIQITVEGFKQSGTTDEIKLVRQQSQAKMDRRMSQLKLFGKGTTLSRIQSVQSGSSTTQMSVLNNYPIYNQNVLQRNFSMQSSSLSNGNQLSRESLQSQQNKTSSFGQLNRSSGLGKHMSMQDSKTGMYRFLTITEANSIASVSNDDRVQGNELGRNFSMHRDSFGHRNKNSQQSGIHEEAKINVLQLSTISESVFSSEHPSTLNQVKNQSSYSKNNQSLVASSPIGEISPEQKNIQNLTFNAGRLNLKPLSQETSSQPLQFPQISLNLGDEVDDIDQQVFRPKPYFMRGNDSEEELNFILSGGSLNTEPTSANPVLENKNQPQKAQIQLDLQKQASQFNFNRTQSNKLKKGVSGINLDLLDRAQRVASTMELESQNPYTKQLEERVAYLEQTNHMLMQNMLFMQAQLSQAFPDLFQGQIPYQLGMHSQGPGEPLMQVDEETSNLDTTQSFTNHSRQVISWPSEIGGFVPQSNGNMSCSRSIKPLQSQMSSTDSHLHANLSSGGNTAPFLKNQASTFTQQLPKMNSGQMSNMLYLQTNPSGTKYEHSKTVPSPDSIYNSSPERRQQKMPEIVFAYADVMLKKLRLSDEFVPLKDNESLQPDLMYDQIMHRVRESQLKLTVKKTPLKKEILLKLLVEPIKILFILCHGDIDDDKPEASFFCLEDEEDPSMIDYFDEARLKMLLRGKQIQCEMIVISACHSSRLADILKRHGAKAVIAINSAEKVLEKAAQQFNMIFLENMLEGKAANEAFETAVNNVRSMKREDVAICCCMHSHKKGCLWLELKRKDAQKAHDIHCAQCLCYEQAKMPNTTEISHTGHCKYYKNFVKELQKMNYANFILLSEEKGFCKPLPQNLQPEDRFHMCCCSSELPHNESQKIICIGELNQNFFTRDDSELDQVKEGNPIEQKPDLSKINLPVDSRPEYQGRKLEKSKIIQFLLNKNEKLLYVHGVQAAGKLGAVIKAVRFVAERNNLSFKDGAFLTDVEGCNTIGKIMLKIAEKAQLYQKDPTQSDIINWFKNEGLNSKNYLLVIKNVGLLKEEDVIRQFKEFIKKVITNTTSLKIIIISSDLQAFTEFKTTSVQKLEFVKLSQKQLADYLRQLLKAKRKLKYVNNIDLENHDLFKMQHLDIHLLPEIVQDISETQTLDKIAENYQAQFQRLQAEQSTQENKVDIELVMQSLVCQKLLDQSRSEHMVYFTLFLIHAPDGLCQMEIKHLSKLRPDLFTQEFIRQLNDVSNADIQDAEDFDGAEIVDREHQFEDQIGSIKKCLLHFFSIDKVPDIQEKKFKIHQLQRKALTFLYQRQQLENHFGSFDSYETLSIEFFSRYAIKLHQKITKSKRNGEVDHNIASMHLQQGIWCWEEDDDEELVEFNQEPIDLPNQGQDKSAFGSEMCFAKRYTSIESNFIDILDHVKLMKYFDMNGEKEYDFERACIINMTMAVPSILVELDRVDEAINLIEACSKIGLGGPKLWMHAQLDLMRASLMINRKKDLVQRFEKIMGLLCNARQIYDDKNIYMASQGIAESYYLQGLLLAHLDAHQQYQISYVQKSRFLKHTQSQKFEDNFDIDDLTAEEQTSNRIFSRRKESDFNCLCHQEQEEHRYPELDISLDSKGETPGMNEGHDLCKGSNALHCFYQAIQFYENDYDPEDGGHFGLGKSLLMYIEVQIKEGLRKANKKQYFSIHEERMLEHLKVAGQQFAALQMQKYIVYQKMLQSKIWHQLEKLEDASRLINDAQTLAEKIKIKDNSMLAEIQNVKNQILEDIRKNYSNLMTFAYSIPLVVEDSSKGIIPVTDTIKSTFDMRNGISHELGRTGKLFQTNFDILSEDLLKNVAQSGTRVLHLSSDRIDEQNLCVERENGVAQYLSLNRIEQMLRPYTKLTGKLPMDVVCIAIPKSCKIGDVFSSLGVPHVLTFDLKLPSDQEKDTFKQHMIDPYRFNYIYGFCISFYSGLARELTVKEAYLSAKETMDDEIKQLEYVWMLNADRQSVFEISDLGITPVLIGEDQARHNNKLYDSAQKLNPSMMLKVGDIMDTSKQRGQLVGMKKPKTAFIGQHKNLHHVIKQLSDPFSPIVLIHVKGSKHVGKTRFIQEVAYYFHRRNQFTFKINYIDLAKINSRTAFKELLNNLEADCKAMTQNNDDDSSSKSEEDIRPHSSRQINLQSNASKKYDLLWVFDNAHALTENHWSHFEPRIAKNCKSDCVKIIISSNQKKSKNRNFHSFARVGQPLKSGGEIKEKPLIMDEIRLTELTEFQAVDLLLSSCDREITKEELGLKATDHKSIHEHLRLEGNIEKLKKLPKYILEFANLLKDYKYDDIQINIREEDKLQGVPNSHRMKQGQAIEIVPKNKIKKAKNNNIQKNKRETRQKNKVEEHTQISVNLSNTPSQRPQKTQSIEKPTEPSQSPVEIMVTFQTETQTSFELPSYEEDGKKQTDPQLTKKVSQMSAQSNSKDQQPRIPTHSQFNPSNMIMEISSSEYESVENRSRTTSFNLETPNLRNLRNAMESPELQRARQIQSKVLEDAKSHFSKQETMQADDQRNRLFSGADADFAKQMSMTECLMPEISSQSCSADSYVISNTKIAKQISQMPSEQVLMPKLKKRQPELQKGISRDNLNSEETKEQPKLNSELKILEDIDFELDQINIQQASSPELLQKKAQSEMGIIRLQSLMFQKSEDHFKTDQLARSNTEDISLASESPTDLDSRQLRIGGKRKSLNTSGKKKGEKKPQNEAIKGTKPTTSKSGKHVNKFAPKKKNKLREMRAEKGKRMEPQDEDRVIEQSSEESSQSSEERPSKEVKGNNKTKKYNKFAEEQKQHNQRDHSD